MHLACDNCGREVDVPEDFSGAAVTCLNCGREVPLAEAEEAAESEGGEAGAPPVKGETPAATPQIEERPAAPMSPEEYRGRVEGQKFRGRAVTLLCILALLTGAAGFFLYKVPPAEVMEYLTEYSEKRARQKVFDAAGLAPARFYQSKSLPGLRGQTGSAGGWEIQEAGKTYLVVEMDAAPRHFLPSEEQYKRIVAEAEYKKQRDPDHEVPPKERCRFFDPVRFALIAEGMEPARGTLININHGEYQGFYDSFRVIFPKSSPEAGAGYLEKAMLLSVAFVVPESGVPLEALWLQLDGLNPLHIPPPKK